MGLNLDKCRFMCLAKDTENETFIFNNFIFNNSNEEKILGFTCDWDLTFKSHIKFLCKKASQKIEALLRLLNHLSECQKRLICNSIRGHSVSTFSQSDQNLDPLPPTLFTLV